MPNPLEQSIENAVDQFGGALAPKKPDATKRFAAAVLNLHPETIDKSLDFESYGTLLVHTDESNGVKSKRYRYLLSFRGLVVLVMGTGAVVAPGVSPLARAAAVLGFWQHVRKVVFRDLNPLCAELIRSIWGTGHADAHLTIEEITELLNRVRRHDGVDDELSRQNVHNALSELCSLKSVIQERGKWRLRDRVEVVYDL